MPGVYFQLRQLRPVARSLPEEAAKMLLQAFIPCRLDYCNALIYRIKDTVHVSASAVDSERGGASSLLIFSQVRGDVITSHQFSAIFSGFQRNSESSINWPPSSTSPVVPGAWDSLPPDIRAAASPAVFKKLLKTHFLTHHFPPVSF